MEKYPSQKFQKEWVQNPINADIVNWTKSFGEYLQLKEGYVKGLTTSQIRKFFGELKRIQADPEKFQEEIPLLKAKLAYAVGRDKNNRGENSSKVKEFYEELATGIDSIRPGNKEDLFRFIKIVESTVAFHKYYGGKDN